jgi:aspartyl protease family protein
VAAGSTVNGVKLLSVSGGDAVVEVQGKRVKLALGGAQVNLGGKPTEGSGSQIVLTAGSGGHFFANGSINGKAVRFVVDTGATYVSMGAAEAERLGIDFRRGERGMTQTANGTMAAYKVMLASVRIGDVQVYNVEALVGQSGMDQILLGNSFLTRFQMKRENDLMTLNRRY